MQFAHNIGITVALIMFFLSDVQGLKPSCYLEFDPACSNIAFSFCDTEVKRCQCLPRFTEVNDECLPQLGAFCDKPLTECKSLPNSVCSPSYRCTCIDGYDKVDNVCVVASVSQGRQFQPAPQVPRPPPPALSPQRQKQQEYIQQQLNRFMSGPSIPAKTSSSGVGFDQQLIPQPQATSRHRSWPSPSNKGAPGNLKMVGDVMTAGETSLPAEDRILPMSKEQAKPYQTISASSAFPQDVFGANKLAAAMEASMQYAVASSNDQKDPTSSSNYFSNPVSGRAAAKVPAEQLSASDLQMYLQFARLKDSSPGIQMPELPSLSSQLNQAAEQLSSPFQGQQLSTAGQFIPSGQNAAQPSLSSLQALQAQSAAANGGQKGLVQELKMMIQALESDAAAGNQQAPSVRGPTQNQGLRPMPPPQNSASLPDQSSSVSSQRTGANSESLLGMMMTNQPMPPYSNNKPLRPSSYESSEGMIQPSAPGIPQFKPQSQPPTTVTNINRVNSKDLNSNINSNIVSSLEVQSSAIGWPASQASSSPQAMSSTTFQFPDLMANIHHASAPKLGADPKLETGELSGTSVLGKKCQLNFECQTTTAYSVCIHSICQCQMHYLQVGTKCFPGLGRTCSADLPCVVPQAVCNAQAICECEASFRDIQGMCLPASPTECQKVGEPCQGVLNSVCDQQRMCTCLPGYKSYSGTCQKSTYFAESTLLGSACDGQCSAPNAYCDSARRCSCMPGFFENGGVCRAVSLSETKCITSPQCLSKDVNSECRDHYCVCSESHILLLGRCYPRLGARCDDTLPCGTYGSFCAPEKVCKCKHDHYTVHGECKHVNIGQIIDPNTGTLFSDASSGSQSSLQSQPRRECAQPGEMCHGMVNLVCTLDYTCQCVDPLAKPENGCVRLLPTAPTESIQSQQATQQSSSLALSLNDLGAGEGISARIAPESLFETFRPSMVSQAAKPGRNLEMFGAQSLSGLIPQAEKIQAEDVNELNFAWHQKRNGYNYY